WKKNKFRAMIKHGRTSTCDAPRSRHSILTVDHKRVMTLKQCFKMFQRNLDTKEQLKQWTSPSEPVPKKAKTLAKKKVLFHQDNLRVHTCSTPMAKFNKFRYELLPHPAYSPDLAPCDYFLFPNLKKMVRRKEIHHQRTAHHRNRGLF
ncbi:SETMR methyltransferase, partial [Acromyrmex insinuator]